jgi:hypothetical protein
MRIIIRPVVDRQREIDLTQRLIAAIAEELWRLYGGNEQLNWLEAEMHLRGIVGEARAEAGITDFVFVEPLVTGAVAEEPAVANAVEPRRMTPGQSRSASRPRAARTVRRQMAVIA